MSNQRSDTLDQALNDLIELELDDAGLQEIPNQIAALPPPIPTDITAKLQDDTDTSRTQPQVRQMPPVDLSNDAKALIRTCIGELERDPTPERAARLHCEIAHAYEETLYDLALACKHYELAIVALPKSLPAIRGARRVYLATGDVQQALPLFEAEAYLCPDPQVQALLHYERARLLEGFSGRIAEAKKTYTKALALDPDNASIIEALKRLALRTSDWEGARKASEQATSILVGDPALRAAMLVERAKLAEAKFDDMSSAISLCEAALQLDPNALGALELLERLYHHRRDWQPLCDVLERQAKRTSDERVRARALHKLGRLHAERLGNRIEAMQALEHAAKASEYENRLILDDLVYLYESNHDHEPLSRALRTQLETATTSDEQVVLLHKLGLLHERDLSNEDDAIRYYAAALRIEPTHTPTLQALAAVYIRRAEFRPLVDIHQAEADASDSVSHRADVHARIAEIFEVHLRQPDEAIVHYERALTLVPAHEPAFRSITRLYAAARKYRELVEHYERALERAPDREYKLTYLVKIGSLWEDALGDPAQAAYAYRRILRIDARNLGAIHALQRTTEQAGKYRELVEALELEVRESKIAAVQIPLLHRAGTILDEKLADRDGALARFHRVLELDASYAPALTSLATIFHREGRWNELLDVHDMQLTIATSNRDSSTLLFKMGELCEHKLARIDDAVGYYRRAAELMPAFLPAMRALTRLVRKREQWLELVEVFELDLRDATGKRRRAMLMFCTGQIYEDRLDQPVRAIQYYEGALTEDVNYWPATVALTRLRGEQQAWKPLIDDLHRQGNGTMDPLVSGAARTRQGDVFRDRLHDPQRAIEQFESLVDSQAAKLPALLALEYLYAKTNTWEALAAVYEAKSETIADSGARVASLRELLNVQQVKSVGDLRQQTVTHQSILNLLPHDPLALDGLHRLSARVGDEATLARICRILGDTTTDPSLGARYLTGVGQAFERMGAPEATSAYRRALELDAGCLGAIRGLARTSRTNGDHAAVAEATRLEAAFLDDPQIVADLLVQSADIRLEYLNDRIGAADDLERALDVWPDHREAAKKLSPTLLGSGQIERLLNVYARAAGQAAESRMAATHWYGVATLHMDHLGDFGSGIAALQRALSLHPTHVSSLRKLGDSYIRDRRYDEAVELYAKVVDVSAHRTVLCDSQLTLAHLYGYQQGQIEKALACYSAVLDIDPYHRRALVELADFHLHRGNGDAAAETGHRMVSSAHNTETRAWALVQLSNIEQKRGELERAEHALIEALAIEGPGGDAANAFRELIQSLGSWVGYATGLTAYVQRATGDAAKKVEMAYLELAKVHGDLMGQPVQAVAKLEEASTVLAGNVAISFELAKRLCEAGRYHDGIARLQALLDQDVTRADVWRTLSNTLDTLGQPDEAVMTMAPLVVLQAADGLERTKWFTRTAKPADLPPGSFAIDTLPKLAAERAMSNAAAEIIAVLAEGLGRLYRPDLEILGISRRDRISARSRHPLRALADHVAGIFNIEYELYLHPRTTPAASLEMTEPASIIIAEHVADLPRPQQVFLLAAAMAPIAGRFYPIEKLSARELELNLTAATSIVVPGFGGDFPDDEFASHAQKVKRLVPRKWRRNLEVAAAEYAARPLANVETWKTAMHRTALRTGLLLSDDLLGVIEVMREEEEIHDVRGIELLQRSPDIADLVRFWGSTEALTVRRELGQL